LWRGLETPQGTPSGLGWQEGAGRASIAEREPEEDKKEEKKEGEMADRKEVIHYATR